jgi:transporter, CPA2 family (2.A.37)
MPVLYVVAQIGLVLYMFLVGLDFDVELLGSGPGAP